MTKQELEKIISLFGQLPVTTRFVIWWRLVLGMTFEKIASLVPVRGKPVSKQAIQKRYNKGLEKIVKLYEQ